MSKWRIQILETSVSGYAWCGIRWAPWRARGHALKSLAWKLGLQPSSFGALLQWLCWVEQWKTRGWLERTAGQHFLTGLCISAGISNVFQGSQLGICLFLTHPLTMLSILPEEFTNVLGFKLLIHTADFLGLSFPISQWRVWPYEMKGIPLLWYLLIFKGAETNFGILHGTHLVWILLGSVTRPALPSLQLYLLLSTQEGTLTNLCLQVLRLIFLQVLWASFCSRDDFAAQRYWHSDVGRMLSRQFEDQSVTLSGGWSMRSSYWDHLLMDVCQLAQPFLWYYYFRDKKRPAGLKKKYGSQKSSLSSVKLRQLLSICMMWHQVVLVWPLRCLLWKKNKLDLLQIHIKDPFTYSVSNTWLGPRV